MKNILKRMIPVLVALILIAVISGIYIVPQSYQKYSYSSEQYDLSEYYQIFSPEDVPIILQDEVIHVNAKSKFGTYYLGLDTVRSYFTERFYINDEENVICFTLPDRVVVSEIGEEVNYYHKGEEQIGTAYPIAYYQADTLYIAIDFVKQFVNFSYEVFEGPKRMQVYTEWTTKEAVKAEKDSHVRYRGGVKSPILTAVEKGDELYIMEELEDWVQVQTLDGYIGYIEKKMLGDKYSVTQSPVTDVNFDYTGNVFPGRINMAFQQIFAENDGGILTSALANTKSVNVISPTWFRLKDTGGSFQSLANHNYVKTAHDKGIQVWALLTDVDEVSDLVDEYTLFSKSEFRKNLIDGLIAKVLEYEIDGINVDLEKIDSATGPHFVQFLRELSIETRANGIYLSVDNYVPTASTTYYNRKEQGIVCDYVVIMGYDEHWSGSSEVGSVASIGYVSDGITNTMKNVPANKIINAIPFYTRIWCTEGTTVTNETVGMQMANDWVKNHNLTPVWDEETQQNYATYESNNKVYQVWLEDADSIAVKLSVMGTHQIAGVAEWKLGFETADIWDVIADYVK